MRTAPVLALAAVGLAGSLVLLGGCGGPTKAGREARTAAADRVSAFSAGATFQQAEQELVAGRFDRAIDSIDRAISAQPDMPEYRILKGRAMLESDRLQRAEEAFVGAVAAAERSIAAIDERVAERQERSGEPLKERDLERIEIERRAVRRVEAEAWYYLGIVRQRWNRIEQAAADYAQAHDVDPQPVAYLVAACEMLLDLRRPEEAEAMIEPVIDRYEGDPSLLVLLARAAMLRDDPVEAAARYAEARVLRPDDSLLTEEYVRAAFEAGLYRDVLATLDVHAAGFAEPRPDLLRIEARAEAMLGRLETADAVYRELLRHAPGDVQAWVEHGTLAWEMGEMARLEACGVRVVRLASERWEGWMYRGLAAEANEELDEAERLLREATDRAPQDALPHLMLARVLEARGDRDAAEGAWLAAIAASPEDADVRRLAEARIAAIVAGASAAAAEGGSPSGG